MVQAENNGGRRISPTQNFLYGVARELPTIIVNGGILSLPRRKIPWEKLPIISDRIRNITVPNAIGEVYSWLREQTFDEDQGAFRTIFGDPTIAGTNKPEISEIELKGKGYNSIAFAFSSNGKRWIVKIGSFTSPDVAFFIPPNDSALAQELRENELILKEGMRLYDLPNLISQPQVFRHTKFRNSIGRFIERTVQISPYEDFLSTHEIADLVNSDPDIGRQLQEEFRRYTNLRGWMINHTDHRSDFDLHGPDNVTVVRTPTTDPEHPFEYHIKVLDFGLRVHGQNTPIADITFDIEGIIHATEFRRAIHGKTGYTLGEDLQAFLDDYIPDFITEGLLMIEGMFVRRDIRAKALYDFLTYVHDIFFESKEPKKPQNDTEDVAVTEDIIS